MTSEPKIGLQPCPERALLDFVSIFQTFWANGLNRLAIVSIFGFLGNSKVITWYIYVFKKEFHVKQTCFLGWGPISSIK